MPNTPVGQIRKSISGKNIVTFRYANLFRVCEPHVYGMANSRLQLLCWQENGESQRAGIPQWRRFDIEDIEDFKILSETFPGKRFVPHPHSKWDKVILTV